MAETPIHVEIHPPERGQRRGVVLFGTCCCSCCCCCLHVVGGLIGAMMSSARNTVAEAPPHIPQDAIEHFHPGGRPTATEHVAGGPDRSVSEAEAERDLPAALPDLPPMIAPRGLFASLGGIGLYWLTFLALIPIACVGFAFWIGNGSELLLSCLIVIFGVLPIVQIAASIVSALLVFLWNPDDRLPRWRAIGHVTLWTVGGTLIGLLIMAPCLGIFR